MEYFRASEALTLARAAKISHCSVGAHARMRRGDARVSIRDVSKLLNSVLSERAEQGTIRMRVRVRIEGVTSRTEHCLEGFAA